MSKLPDILSSILLLTPESGSKRFQFENQK